MRRAPCRLALGLCCLGRRWHLATEEVVLGKELARESHSDLGRSLPPKPHLLYLDPQGLRIKRA